MESLPICRWRREATLADRHACVSPKILTGPHGVLDSQCGHCFARDHPAPERPRGRCIHLGPRTGLQPCLPCSRAAGRSVQLPLHACAVHGQCTIDAAAPGTACCRTCGDHAPEWVRDGAGRIRHLTYHLYPVGEAWRWNVAQLLQRLSLFNGRRLVAVATSPATASFADVCAHFAGLDVECIEVPNDGTLREMSSYPLLVEALEGYRGVHDVTWYGHGKGATSEAWAPGARRWTTAMYEALLDHWPAVRRALRSACAVGIYRRRRAGLPGHSVPWHYSGTFRWARNADLYSRNWRQIAQNWCGSEGHVPTLFAVEETACLHGEFGASGLGLYLEETWRDWAAASHRAWCDDHVADRETPLLTTVILTAHAQPELVHEAIASVRAQTSDSWQLLVVDSGPLAAAGAYARYAADARISVMVTGETPEQQRSLGMQAWAINEAWRRGRVRGDLVCHLSDDDLLDPEWVASAIGAAQARPDQSAWYGWAERQALDLDGSVRGMGSLELKGICCPGRSLDCKADGMQFVHRRAVRTAWSTDRSVAWHADGQWIDALARTTPIYPLDARVGIHRHTPRSTYTRGAT
jgi:hypothetical protein